MIGIIDTKDLDRKYTQKKHASKIDFINLEARNLFSYKSSTPSAIKCTHGFDYYGTRDEIINKN